MESDVIDRTTATCAVRTFTCLGANSNIEVILVDGAGRHVCSKLVNVVHLKKTQKE